MPAPDLLGTGRLLPAGYGFLYPVHRLADCFAVLRHKGMDGSNYLQLSGSPIFYGAVELPLLYRLVRAKQGLCFGIFGNPGCQSTGGHELRKLIVLIPNNPHILGKLGTLLKR